MKGNDIVWLMEYDGYDELCAQPDHTKYIFSTQCVYCAIYMLKWVFTYIGYAWVG